MTVPPARDVLHAVLRDNPALVRKLLVASPFLNPRGYLENSGTSYKEFFARYAEFDPAVTALGQVQHRFRNWTEAVINGFDHGINGNIGAHPGRFTAGELDCDNLLFWLDGLADTGHGLPGARRAVARIAEGGATVGEAAAAAAEFYALLPGAVRDTGARTERTGVAAPAPLEIGSLGAADSYAAPADELASYLKDEAGWAFEFLVLHGSYATGDYVPGSSDLDTFGVLRKEAASSAEEMLRLRDAVLPAWRHLYSIDPLQHHGVMLVAAQDADFYAQHFFPLELFRHAKTIAGGRASFGVRDSRFDETVIMHQILHGLLCMEPGSLDGLSVHKLKWHLQLVVLLPALSSMTEQRYMYKRDSFEEIGRILDWGDLSSLRTCSRARSRNMYGKSAFDWGRKGGIGALLSAYRSEVLERPPPPALASAIGGDFVPGLRTLATRLAARMISGLFSRRYPYMQAAFEWEDEPPPAEPREYDEAAASVAAKITARYRNVSVLRQGGAGAPGISDLDLIVCVGGETDAGALAGDWEGMLDPGESRLCTHAPFMIPDGMVGSLQELWPVSGLARPDGSPVDGVPPVPDWKAHLFTVPELYVFINVLAGYTEAFAGGRIRERAALAALKSMTHTLAILRANGIDLADAAFEDDLDGLRASWFGTDGAERRSLLLDLYVRSLGIHLGIIDAVRSRVARAVGYGGADPSGSVFDQVVFVRDWSPRAALDCISAQMYKTGNHLHVMPAEFLIQLCLYAKRPGPLSRYLSGHMTHNLDAALVSGDPFERRARLLDRAIGDLRRMGIQTPILPTFQPRPAPGYAGMRHSLLSMVSDPGGAVPEANRIERMHHGAVEQGNAIQELHAEQARMLAEAERAREDAARELRREQDTVRELRQKQDELSRTLADIHRSLTWRALRRYSSAVGRLASLRPGAPGARSAGDPDADRR